MGNFRSDQQLGKLRERVDELERRLASVLGEAAPPASGLTSQVHRINDYLYHRDGSRYLEPFVLPDWITESHPEFDFLPDSAIRYQVRADGLIKNAARKKGVLHEYCIRSTLQFESISKFVLAWSASQRLDHLTNAWSVYKSSFKSKKEQEESDRSRIIYPPKVKQSVGEIASFTTFHIERIILIMLLGWAPEYQGVWKMEKSKQGRNEEWSRKLYIAFSQMRTVRNICLHRGADEYESVETRLNEDEYVGGLFTTNPDLVFSKLQKSFDEFVELVHEYIRRNAT
jgi:hypothetical protein